MSICEFLTSTFSLVSGDLDRAAENLFYDGEKLRDLRTDVEESSEAARRQKMVPTHRVLSWLKMTETVLSEVDIFRTKYSDWRGEYHSLLVFLPNLACYALRRSRYLREADNLRTRVGDLITKAESQVGSEARLPHLPPIELVPSSALRLIGRQKVLEDILSYLSDDHPAKIIGICGMAGVGKTALVQAVNNCMYERFQRSTIPFELVIWTSLARDSDLEKLRRDIVKRCGLTRERPHRSDAEIYGGFDAGDVQGLFGFLVNKKFLLIIDDVRTPFDLEKVGIPRPSEKNKNKIIFITRSNRVHYAMDADTRIEVDPLNDGDSWELFRTRVPAEILNSPSVQERARALVVECGGLPVTLVTVGRAMATKRTSPEWEQACKSLREAITGLRGMEAVVAVLKLSFDGLEDDLRRRCLLHCCRSFPRGGNIDVEELVTSLIEGGCLDEVGAEGRRAMAFTVIGDLKAEFLLQNGRGGDNLVMIHPAVRSMAFSIAKG